MTFFALSFVYIILLLTSVSICCKETEEDDAIRDLLELQKPQIETDANGGVTRRYSVGTVLNYALVG